MSKWCRSAALLVLLLRTDFGDSPRRRNLVYSNAISGPSEASTSSVLDHSSDAYSFLLPVAYEVLFVICSSTHISGAVLALSPNVNAAKRRARNCTRHSSGQHRSRRPICSLPGAPYYLRMSKKVLRSTDSVVQLVKWSIDLRASIL